MVHIRDLEVVRLQPALDQSQELEDPAHRRAPRRPEPDERGRGGGLDELGAKVDTASPSSAPALARSGAAISTGIVSTSSHNVAGRAKVGLVLAPRRPRRRTAAPPTPASLAIRPPDLIEN
jgi:hypothetical protein